MLTWDNEKIKAEKEFELAEAHIKLLKDSVEKKDKELGLSV